MLLHIHTLGAQRTIDVARTGALASRLLSLVRDSDFKESQHPRDDDGKFAPNGGSKDKPTKATAKGSKAGVHELLSSGHAFSLEELMAATGTTNKATITTALSDLKNPKYARGLGHLSIVKRADGLYHVEKSSSGPTPEQVVAVRGLKKAIKEEANKPRVLVNEAGKTYRPAVEKAAATREANKTLREEFNKYFDDLRAEARRDGATVNRQHEWEQFKEFKAAQEEDAKHKAESDARWEAMPETQQAKTYKPLSEKMAEIDDPKVKEWVDNILDNSRINADDTVHVERAAKPHEWDSIFRGTAQMMLDTDRDVPSRVKEWFATHMTQPKKTKDSVRVRAHSLDEEFVESEHPRGPDGEFIAKQGVAKARAKPAWTKHGGGEFTAEEHARLRALKVRPDLTEIKLSADPTARLQVVGKDSKGRTQRVYSAEHSEAAAAAKFARLRSFNSVATKIVASAASDMHNPKLPTAQRDAAAIIKLIATTGYRIGSDRDTGADEKAFGVSTLTKEHVKVGKGGEVTLDFPGKSGVRNAKTVKDPEIARYIKGKLASGLDRIFDVPQSTVRNYLKAHSSSEFKVKDFRTWHGTNEALKAIESLPEPTDAKGYAKFRTEVAKRVSSHLGNTPSVALSSYIDPTVFARWSHLQ